ncbi:MAG TPA: type II secretion system F family protein [bacterium]|nr:type II secretion system F family protein [bacterium]HNS48605.1 type II secretion system F family protein [bacterium]
MALFQYSCLNPQGRRQKGRLEAHDAADARQKIKELGLYPIQVEMAAGPDRPTLRPIRRIDHAEAVGAIRQLASLINSHIPVVEAVETVAPQLRNQPLSQSFHNLSESLRRGILFSEALRRENIFPATLAEVVAVSEASGTLGLTLAEYARNEETALTMQRRAVTSLIYPALLATVSILVLLFLFLVVLPKVTAVFAESGVPIPIYTRLIISAVLFLKRYWFFMLLGLLATGLGLRQAWHGPAGRERLWRLVRRLPLIYELLRRRSLALFCRNLSILHRSGVKLIEALRLIERLMTDPAFRSEVQRLQNDLNRGRSLSQAMRSGPAFPPYLLQMVRVGEETGDLSALLEKAAANYEEELETSLARAVGLLEPAMIIIMGIVVGSIVIAVLLPIFEMSRIVR